jgi:hypothetical protein
MMDGWVYRLDFIIESLTLRYAFLTQDSDYKERKVGPAETRLVFNPKLKAIKITRALDPIYKGQQLIATSE